MTWQIKFYPTFKKIKSFVLILLEHENFDGDLYVHKEMKKLKAMMTWIPFFSQFKNLHHYVIIQPLNMISLCQTLQRH
jgi:hypothetical protein